VQKTLGMSWEYGYLQRNSDGPVNGIYDSAFGGMMMNDECVCWSKIGIGKIDKRRGQIQINIFDKVR
jgi:hypothetical protein